MSQQKQGNDVLSATKLKKIQSDFPAHWVAGVAITVPSFLGLFFYAITNGQFLP